MTSNPPFLLSGGLYVPGGQGTIYPSRSLIPTRLDDAESWRYNDGCLGLADDFRGIGPGRVGRGTELRSLESALGSARLEAPDAWSE